MKIQFLQFVSGMYIAPMLISALLKKNGHDVELLIEFDEQKIVSKTAEIKPDVVAFSVTTGNHVWVAKVARAIKEKCNVLTIAGGPHPTFFPDFIKEPGIDIVARGEAEFAFVELMNTLREGKSIAHIKNLWVKEGNIIHKNEIRDLLENLDVLPNPDRSIYKIKKIEKATFVAGRGCPYDCSFCYSPGQMALYRGKGKFVRMKSPPATVNEIVEVKEQYGLKEVVFDDDIFITNRDWLKEFCAIYPHKVGLPYKCFVRANLVDEEIVQLLQRSGCIVVYFGLESGDEKLRKTILRKPVTDNQLIYAAELFHKYRIKFGTFSMMGIPTETTEQAFKTISLNSHIKTDFPRVMILQPYPGTEISKFSVDNGYMDQFNINDFGASFSRKSLIKQKNIDELINLQRLSYFAMMFPILNPLIKWLIKIPPNKLFDSLFLFSVALINAKENQESVIAVVLKNLNLVKQAF